MHLDIFTLLVQLAVLCLVLGAAFLFAWFRMRREPSLLWWGASFLVRSLGLVLLVSRGAIDDRLSIDLANVFLLLGVGLTWAGARVFSRRPVAVWLVLAPVAVWLAACQYPPIYSETGYRICVFSALSAVYSLATGFEFLRDYAHANVFRKMLAFLFTSNGVLQLARATYVLVEPVPQNLLEGNGWHAGWFAMPFLVMVSGALIAASMYREQALQSLQARAERDDLTRVLNRGTFLDRAERAVETGRRGDGMAALILLDLDHFKAINDCHGHQAGDAALVAFAAMAGSCLPGDGLFGRIGGEEFAVLLLNCPLHDAHRVAEDMRAATEALDFRHDGEDISITVSIGLAGAAAGESSFGSLFSRADRALYEAKRAGRNRVEVLHRGAGGRAGESMPAAPAALAGKAG